MEKHHSRSSAKRVPPVNDDSFNLSSFVIGSGAAPPGIAKSGKPKAKPEKPSREDISRCINIWASVYLGDERKSDPGDLQLPSRPWMGRSPNSLKPYE